MLTLCPLKTKQYPTKFRKWLLVVRLAHNPSILSHFHPLLWLFESHVWLLVLLQIRSPSRQKNIYRWRSDRGGRAFISAACPPCMPPRADYYCCCPNRQAAAGVSTDLLKSRARRVSLFVSIYPYVTRPSRTSNLWITSLCCNLHDMIVSCMPVYF
jgi:hypothetical protein